MARARRVKYQPPAIAVKVLHYQLEDVNAQIERRWLNDQSQPKQIRRKL